MLEHGFDAGTCARIGQARHRETAMRCCSDHRGDAIERQSDAAEAPPTARTRIEKPEVQSRGRFYADRRTAGHHFLISGFECCDQHYRFPYARWNPYGTDRSHRYQADVEGDHRL